ncbi:hypothetical protein GCM10027447_36520 [Glycomyces halotolerans]
MTEPVLDQSEAWPRLEAAVHETIAALPDFPGFETRALHELGCEDPTHVKYELSYGFSLADSESGAVRRDYVTILKQHFPTIGYDVHDERYGEDGQPRGLEALRVADGINVWYRILGLVSIKAQSGCVRRVDGFEPYCPRPLGGVVRDRDAALDYAKRGYTDDEPDPDPIARIDPYEL